MQAQRYCVILPDFIGYFLRPVYDCFTIDTFFIFIYIYIMCAYLLGLFFFFLRILQISQSFDANIKEPV